MIFGMLNPEKIWHEILQVYPPRLSYVATLPWEIQKKSFSAVLFIHTCTSDYLCYLRRKQTVIHLPTPSENVTTLTCELQKPFSSDWRFVAFFQTLELWKEPVVDCRRWLCKEPVVQQLLLVFFWANVNNLKYMNNNVEKMTFVVDFPR